MSLIDVFLLSFFATLTLVSVFVTFYAYVSKKRYENSYLPVLKSKNNSDIIGDDVSTYMEASKNKTDVNYYVKYHVFGSFSSKKVDK